MFRGVKALKVRKVLLKMWKMCSFTFRSKNSGMRHKLCRRTISTTPRYLFIHMYITASMWCRVTFYYIIINSYFSLVTVKYNNVVVLYRLGIVVKSNTYLNTYLSGTEAHTNRNTTQVTCERIYKLGTRAHNIIIFTKGIFTHYIFSSVGISKFTNA